MQDDDLLRDVENNIIDEMRQACAKKRNVLHFWSEPHSVRELETLLREKLPPVQAAALP